MSLIKRVKSLFLDLRWVDLRLLVTDLALLLVAIVGLAVSSVRAPLTYLWAKQRRSELANRRALIQTPLNLKWLWAWLGVGLFGFVALMSLSAVRVKIGVPLSDLGYHFLAYGALAGWFLQLASGLLQKLKLVALLSTAAFMVESAHVLLLGHGFIEMHLLAAGVGMLAAVMLSLTPLGRIFIRCADWKLHSGSKLLMH